MENISGEVIDALLSFGGYVVTALLFFIIGLSYGLKIAKNSAIKKGVGRYTCTPEGRKRFEWIS